MSAGWSSSSVGAVGHGAWRSDEVIAWTEREGPGRPPPGVNRTTTTALGLGLAAVFTAILFTDSLCPEHRVWVQAMASTALVCSIVASIGLLRRWAVAPLLALPVTLCGVAIGLLDAAHAAARGRAIAVAFSVLAAGAVVLVWRQIALVKWDRSVNRSISPAPPTADPGRPVTQPEHRPVEPSPGEPSLGERSPADDVSLSADRLG
jgi:hypothetical protein